MARFIFNMLSPADQQRYRELSRITSQGKPSVCRPFFMDVVEDDLFHIWKACDDPEKSSEENYKSYKQMEKEYFDKGQDKKNYEFELERWERELKPKQQAELDKYLAAQAEMKRLRSKATA